MNNCNINNTKSQDVILEDRRNNWKNKKMDSIIVGESLVRSDVNSGKYICTCSTNLIFTGEDINNKKLIYANFCKARLCPMCSWRKSRLIFGQIAKISSEIDKINKYNYLFLTLTQKNCIVEDLEDNIKKLHIAFNRMFKYKLIKNICKGYFRATEVTYNKKDNTYHPHIHIILLVNKSYFTCKNKNEIGYLTQNDFTNLWQKALDVDYKPIVDIRKIKKYDYKTISEVAKYTVKSSDIIIYDKFNNLNDKHIVSLHLALKNKRLIGLSGIFKELHSKLNLQDLNSDDVDFVNADLKDKEDTLSKFFIFHFKWNVGLSNYYLIDNNKFSNYIVENLKR